MADVIQRTPIFRAEKVRQKVRKGRTKGRTKNATHPGITLLPPDAKNRFWRLKYRDPDQRDPKDPSKGRMVKVSLGPLDGKTRDTAKQAAQAKAEEIHGIVRDRRRGVAKPVDVTLADAIAAFLESGGKRGKFSASTRRTYKDVLDAFEGSAPVRFTRELTVAHIAKFEASRKSASKKVSLAGGKKGATKDEGDRSPHTVNKEMRAVKAFLRWARKAHGVQLSRDQIFEAWDATSAPVERRDFLRPDEIRTLLDSAAQHDAATFIETRAEHAGEGERGTTQRYTAVAPLVRCLLLTGMRIGEALAIRWSDVEDERIHIRAAISKTKQARDVDLTVAPTALPATRGEPGELVFPLTRGEVRAAERRMIASFGAPDWSPHKLRRTCSTFFTCAFNPWRSAKSIGHSVTVMEKHYASLVKVATGCTTLEDAMQLSASACDNVSS